MAKKPASTLAEGTRVRASAGVSAPEFPDVSIAGWTGAIFEVSGKKPAIKYVVEWDEATVQKMPAPYVAKCEADGLYYRMACLSAQEIEVEGMKDEGA